MHMRAAGACMRAHARPVLGLLPLRSAVAAASQTLPTSRLGPRLHQTQHARPLRCLQVAYCDTLLSPLRRSARQAISAMDRKPISDLVS